MTAEGHAHLQGPTTTVVRCLALTRRDGLTLGFTDHDRALSFEGIAFRPESGTALSALAFGTGLAVDNAEATGALSDAAITEADIRAGRWDGAEVRLWAVDWPEPERRVLRFRGTLGEITRQGAAFTAELRGLAEALNRPQGRLFQARCPAVLGDAACGVDLAAPGLRVAATVVAVEGGRTLLVSGAGGAATGWFAEGLAQVTGGAAVGLAATIRSDRIEAGGLRRVELWQGIDAGLAAGDPVTLVAGCDRRAETCREKFGNILNFRGFPHVPGEDWLLTVPARTARRDGGALRQ